MTVFGYELLQVSETVDERVGVGFPNPPRQCVKCRDPIRGEVAKAPGGCRGASVVEAGAARQGLWGNHGYEAVWQYENGDFLHGSHSYELTFSPPPMVGAFWSLTMYDVPDYYLVVNPIDRYSIGDRTPGLRYNADGSITIYMQNGSPGPETESNWLPSPEGQFRPVLRAYQPEPDMLDGSYKLPKVSRAG